MSFKAGRLFAGALVVSLIIQMQIAGNGLRRSAEAKIAFTCSARRESLISASWTATESNRE